MCGGSNVSSKRLLPRNPDHGDIAVWDSVSKSWLPEPNQGGFNPESNQNITGSYSFNKQIKYIPTINLEPPSSGFSLGAVVDNKPAFFLTNGKIFQLDLTGVTDDKTIVFPNESGNIPIVENSSPGQIGSFWCGTQAQYDALSVVNPNTVYFIKED